MDKQLIKLWYDPEADLLEVVLEEGIGIAKDTQDDHMEVRVDGRGKILSFHVLGLRSMTGLPLSLELRPNRKTLSKRA
ncbi:MAG: DUF2283 domain-containing protein [Chloroflexi bacterium]|nr:DUF2283 domain-containing protein [Chloroflexota bacterium]